MVKEEKSISMNISLCDMKITTDKRDEERVEDVIHEFREYAQPFIFVG
jgi:hypothetical protein